MNNETSTNEASHPPVVRNVDYGGGNDPNNNDNDDEQYPQQDDLEEDLFLQHPLVLHRINQNIAGRQRREQRRLVTYREQDVKATGAMMREVGASSTSPSPSGNSFHCLEKAPRHILTHIARIKGTYPRLNFYGETKRATHSGMYGLARKQIFRNR
jgi:hypothetical protein